MSESTLRFGELLVQTGLVTELQLKEGLAVDPSSGNRLGDVLVSKGFLTRVQLQRALSEAIARGMTVVDRPPLGEILVGMGTVQPSQLEPALKSQRRDGRRLGEVLVETGVVTEKGLFDALSVQARLTPAPDAETKNLANGKQLVVIDDSPLACSLITDGLVTFGYEVTTFIDPLQALKELPTLRPDLVLSDLEMPGFDGPSMCRKIKSALQTVPVIILTANDDASQRVELLRAGADDYIHKGASMNELAARIEAVLRRTDETERIRRLFARYTSDAVVDEVLKQGTLVLTGEKRDVTVLFADIRNFTGVAESYPPEVVVSVLNEILGQLADTVLEWGGTLDKFLGDGLMAVWGAPVQRPDDAESALAAAVAMMKSVAARNASDTRGLQLELGVGVNSGPVVAGSFGSTRRTEYTCIGDTVNVASRLCGLAPGGDIYVGEATASLLKSTEGLSALPPAKVKGKASTVGLFKATDALEHVLQGQRRF